MVPYLDSIDSREIKESKDAQTVTNSSDCVPTLDNYSLTIYDNKNNCDMFIVITNDDIHTSMTSSKILSKSTSNIYVSKSTSPTSTTNIHDRSNWQTIITKTFDSLQKFNQIYIKVYYENINDTNIQLNKLLQYLILNLESERSNNNKIITIQFIKRSNKQTINERESLECKYSSATKTTDNAIKISIEFNNQLIHGYLCFKNRNIIQLNTVYIWKILTDIIDNINEQIIFECDNIKALIFICNSWQQLCTNGQVMIDSFVTPQELTFLGTRELTDDKLTFSLCDYLCDVSI